jgi:hypothetical protein
VAPALPLLLGDSNRGWLGEEGDTRARAGLKAAQRQLPHQRMSDSQELKERRSTEEMFVGKKGFRELPRGRVSWMPACPVPDTLVCALAGAGGRRSRADEGPKQRRRRRSYVVLLWLRWRPQEGAQAWLLLLL